ncbi:aspartyl/asparaginyl beta-hydroxylase domain-containing protein [Danxiaibacter flavus]|uniref:Aspartyl/asparaginyl beta-hydroxylase domain-containing protein n=2 Tax=Danxiaibacter flavus TaxID=3049108 RepID=A0ABV3ZK29_9BACT
MNIDIQAIQKEVMQLSSDWQLHLNIKDYAGSWSALSLRSPGGKANNIIPQLLSDTQVFEDTPLMTQCPAIQKVIAGLECPVCSVRLLNLTSGSVIKPHKDADLAFEKGEARLHIPIFTNEKVLFYSEDELVPMREGECWYLNANLIHSVENNSNSDRIHLVIDCMVNDWLKDIFDNAEKSEKEDVENIEETLLVIDELKRSNTPATLAWAASLESRLKQNVLN